MLEQESFVVNVYSVGWTQKVQLILYEQILDFLFPPFKMNFPAMVPPMCFPLFVNNPVGYYVFF